MAAAIGIGLAAANTFSSLSSSRKAKKEARKAAKLERLMTSEELRRLGREQQQVLGSAKSQIAASGFTGYGGSSEAYLADLQTEQSRQQTFTTQVGASKASAIESRGKALASSYKMDAFTSMVQGAGKVGESFNWGLD